MSAGTRLANPKSERKGGCIKNAQYFYNFTTPTNPAIFVKTERTGQGEYLELSWLEQQHQHHTATTRDNSNTSQST